MKTCRKCREEKPLIEFSTHVNTRDGLKTWCRGCMTKSATRSAKLNPEATRVHKQEWKGRNPDKVRAQSRLDNARAYKVRGEVLRARVRAWAAVNRDKIKARYSSPRGRMLRRLSQQRRIARMAGTSSTLTKEQWAALVTMFDGTCAYCPSPWSEIDHVVPVSRGGGLDAGNVVPACKPCNLAKNARSLEIFCALRGLDPEIILCKAGLRWTAPSQL